MLENPRVRAKICCIQNSDEVSLAVRAGAHALGFVSAMPSGPGCLDEETIRDLVPRVPPAVATFLLTSRQEVDSIVQQQRACRVNTLQLCDELTHGTHQDLRRALPGVAIVQVIHVTSEASLEEARRVAPAVDAILLDSGRPHADQKELGGTGRTHDWDISRRICASVPCPVFLAGGLHAGNVREAIERVRPYGVDVCSRIRTDDRLDPKKLTAFLRNITPS